jgi:hypothetical protein
MVSPNNKIRVWLVSRPTHHTVQSLVQALGLSRLPGDRSTPKHTETDRCQSRGASASGNLAVRT